MYALVLHQGVVKLFHFHSVYLGLSAVGRDNKTNQVALGYNSQALESNEVVLGAPECTHIRSTGNNCDLGTASHPFKNLYITGGL